MGKKKSNNKSKKKKDIKPVTSCETHTNTTLGLIWKCDPPSGLSALGHAIFFLYLAFFLFYTNPYLSFLHFNVNFKGYINMENIKQVTKPRTDWCPCALHDPVVMTGSWEIPGDNESSGKFVGLQAFAASPCTQILLIRPTWGIRSDFFPTRSHCWAPLSMKLVALYVAGAPGRTILRVPHLQVLFTIMLRIGVKGYEREETIVWQRWRQKEGGGDTPNCVNCAYLSFKIWDDFHFFLFWPLDRVV